MIIAAHTAVADAVSHAERLKSERYFVWEEDGERSLPSDNAHGERCMRGRSDLYTRKEFDPWGPALGESFDGAGIAWNLVGIDYEAETGVWHWSWDWEVACGNG